MINDMYNTYDGCKFSYYTPSSFDNRTRDYLLSRYTPIAAWDYPETLYITFDLKEVANGPLIDNEELEGKFIRVIFYNFRDEKLPFDFEIPAVNEFVVSLNYDESSKYFLPGTYKCSVQLVDYHDNEIKDYIQSLMVLLSKDECFFYVQ